MDAAAELDAWLKKHVAEPRRALARGAASNLSDYATCEEADLEDVLQISTWPPLARSRFLRAWRKLKGDEAPATVAVATVATQTDIVGPVQPVAAAAMPTGSSRVAVAADDDDFEALDDDDDAAAPPAAINDDFTPDEDDPTQQTRVLTYMGLSLLPIIGLVPFFAGRDFVPADPSLYS